MAKINLKQLFLLLLILLCIPLGLASCSQPPLPQIELTSVNLYKNNDHQYADYIDADYTFCIQSKEEFIIELTFDNPKAHPIFSVAVNDSFVSSAKFLSGSTPQKIRFLYTLPEQAQSSGVESERSIIIERFIFTYSGNPVTKDLSIPIIVPILENPSFTVTLNIEGEADDYSIGYMESLYDFVITKLNFLSTRFGGVYTQDFGEGKKVDYYYFYKNTTLYVLVSDFFIFTLNNEGTEYIVSGLTASGSGITTILLYLPEIHEDLPVTSIGAHAFEGKIFRNMVLPNSIKTIGASAFKDCKSLSGVTLSKDESMLSEIGERAFENTPKLEAFALPPLLTKIGAQAFLNSGLKQTQSSPGSEIIIPSSLQHIGNEAFRKTKAKAIRFAEDATLIHMGEFAFSEMPNLVTVETKYGTTPDTKGIKTIGEGAFYLCKSLSTLLIKDGLEKIDEHAFKDCTALKTVTLHKDVKHIGIEAFMQCNLITFSVAEYSQLISIANGAFRGNRNLAKLDLTHATGLQELGLNPFNQCSSIRQVRLGAAIPPSIKDFTDPNNNKKRLIDGSYEYLKFYVPENSMEDYESAWDSVLVEQGRQILITAIENIFGDWAAKIINDEEVLLFDIFSVSTSLTPPASLFGYPITEIGPYAFHPGIKSITLPLTVKVIHNRAFYKCDQLTSVNFSDLTALTEIGEEAFYETKINSFVANPNLKTIENKAFYNTQMLETVDFRDVDSLTLYTDAFRSSGVKNLYFGEGNLNVQNGAFSSCKGFELIWFAKESPAGIATTAFTNNNTGFTVSVPTQAAIANYQGYLPASANWVSRD